jgi:photosystem II stability/assembly factor-like uncharacterized protein
MKLDLYIKTLLTVIALCLIWICVKDAPSIASANAKESVAPTEVIAFQLAWNERTNTGLFRYRIQNEEKFRSITVRSLADLAGWAALVSQKPLNNDARGWIYTGREPVREQ